MKYLLTIFCLFFVSTGWCIKVSGGSSSRSSPVNLLKGVTATFELWDSTPTALNLTDENFTEATTGNGTVNNVISDFDIGNLIFDLGANYDNIIISVSYSATNILEGYVGLLDLYISDNGTDWTYDQSVYLAGGFIGMGFGSISMKPVNTRYVKLNFYVWTAYASGEWVFGVSISEITATQYK